MAPARQLAALLRALSEHPAGSAAGRVLRSTCPNPAAARRWLDEQTRREPLPLVLRWPAPGLVEIGTEGDTRIYPAPDLKGLDLAHRIFLHSVTGRPALRFADESNALRNLLARAANWAEPRCIELANAIRAISIHAEGEFAVPRFNPRRPVRPVLA